MRERDELVPRRGTPRGGLPRRLDEAPVFMGKATSIYGWLDVGVFLKVSIEVEEPTTPQVRRCLGVAAFSKAGYNVDDMLDAKVDLCRVGLHYLRDSFLEDLLGNKYDNEGDEVNETENLSVIPLFGLLCRPCLFFGLSLTS